MAVKWAVANGNWNAGTTWNDGDVPTIGDDVYLNGFVIAIPNSTAYISVKSINNGETPTTGNFGGYLSGGYRNASTSYLYLNADIHACAPNYFWYDGSRHMSLFINGNIKVDANSQLLPNGGSYVHNIYCTGNIYALGILIGNSSPGNFEVVGSVTVGSSIRASMNNVSVIGILNIEGIIVTTTFTINGSITYKSTDNTMGVGYTTLNVLNPDTFTWKDVTEPRSNPFIIVTNAEMNNRQQYPAENKVKEGTEYVWGEKVGTYQAPPEAVVLKDYVYDNGEKVGTLEDQNIVGCVTKEDVREGVELIGLQEVGTLVVPDAGDVREGVVFDNGSVGTLIVEGGGDRLRIADFGYYTRSTSITYIVDLTESDKPAFADCEEIVLRSLFPTLDLDNIPDKFFDDLFVQFLRYRLLVEYYRGTSINSKFTPSEPTSEIVNYANTKCEYWLNTANLFLQLWGEKYPNSVKKDRILL